MFFCDRNDPGALNPRSILCTIFIKKQNYSLLNETLFNTSAMTAASTQNKFTDLHRLGTEQIIFFMSLVKDPFITVKFSQ